MKVSGFSVHVVGAPVWDLTLDNIDTEVRLSDGRRFGATFFTVQNLERLFPKNASTGECGAGLSLWAANMILIRTLSQAAIEGAVEELMKSGEFETAFCALPR